MSSLPNAPRKGSFALRAIAALVTLSVAVAGAAAARHLPEARGVSATTTTRDYTLHEWGTFTTVSGSDGVLLPGLHVEDEELPHFVFAHEGMGLGGGKGWTRPLTNVTVKLETPVIYFYSDSPFAAHVEVGFRGGSISQWYPDRSGGEVPPSSPSFSQMAAPEPQQASGDGASADNEPASIPSGTIDFADGYEGGIAWDVNVMAPGDYPAWLTWKGAETLTWTAPRQVDANLVETASGERERYLFYRGLGNFDLPVRFTVEEGVLLAENLGDQSLPYILVFHHPGETFAPADGTMSLPLEGFRRLAYVRFGVIEALGPGESAEVHIAELPSTADWRPKVYESIAGALTAAGLFEDEADAMLQTWWRSYFEHEGLRLFWVAPPEFVDEILPLQVDPPPAELARVILGRAEVLTPSFEAALGQHLQSAGGHRYYEAYLSRFRALRQTR